MTSAAWGLGASSGAVPGTPSHSPRKTALATSHSVDASGSDQTLETDSHPPPPDGATRDGIQASDGWYLLWLSREGRLLPLTPGLKQACAAGGYSPRVPSPGSTPT